MTGNGTVMKSTGPKGLRAEYGAPGQAEGGAYSRRGGFHRSSLTGLVDIDQPRLTQKLISQYSSEKLSNEHCVH
jgi:hypothetical protein